MFSVVFSFVFFFFLELYFVGGVYYRNNFGISLYSNGLYFYKDDKKFVFDFIYREKISFGIYVDGKLLVKSFKLRGSESFLIRFFKKLGEIL